MVLTSSRSSSTPKPICPRSRRSAPKRARCSEDSSLLHELKRNLSERRFAFIGERLDAAWIVVLRVVDPFRDGHRDEVLREIPGARDVLCLIRRGGEPRLVGFFRDDERHAVMKLRDDAA